MKLHLDQPETSYIIRQFDAGGLTIGHQFYPGSMILTPDSAQLWAVSHVDQLTVNHFSELAQYPTQTLILGTGKHGVFIDPAASHPLIKSGTALEVMSTAAACRTWNILAGDGRNIIAALIFATTS